MHINCRLFSIITEFPDISEGMRGFLDKLKAGGGPCRCYSMVFPCAVEGVCKASEHASDITYRSPGARRVFPNASNLFSAALNMIGAEKIKQSVQESSQKAARARSLATRYRKTVEKAEWSFAIVCRKV